jgi:hypothetical protein
LIWVAIAAAFCLTISLLWTIELMAQSTWNDSVFVVAAWLVAAALVAASAFR